MQPVRLCLSNDNKRIFVTDGENHLILVLNREDGTHIQTIGNGKGKERGQFDSPWGVCISPDGRELYTADKNNHRIQVFNAIDGSYVRTIGRGQLKYPRGVCVSGNGEELYVSENKDVKVLRVADGAHLRTIDEHLVDPDGLCLSHDNELLFVADQTKIVVFRASDGGYVRSIFSRRGDGEDIDVELSDICLSPSGEELYVTDGLYNRVQVLRADDGSFIQNIGDYGQGAGQFVTPLGVCVSRDGEVIVADTWNYRIQVFQL